MNNQFDLDAVLKQMADDHRPELPSPGLIWWRAQILKKQKDKELIERPMVIMRGVAAATCVVALVVLLISSWGQLQGATFGAMRLLMSLLTIALSVCVVSAFLMSRWVKSS